MISIIDTYSLSFASPSNAPLLAFLNRFKGSSRKTAEKNLSIILNLLDPQISRLSPELMRQRLLSFEWQKVTVHFANRVHRLAQDAKYAQSTRNALTGVLRGIAKQRWILGQISHDDYERIAEVGHSMRQRGRRVKRNPPLTADHLLALLSDCRTDKNAMLGKRDAALIALLYGAGLRAAEAVSLKLSAVDWKDQSILVLGKGDDERRVYPVSGVLPFVEEWLSAYTPVGDCLFPAFSPLSRKPMAGREHLPLSYTALYEMIRYRAIRAGIPVYTPHAFRHAFATETYRETQDLFATQLQLGHRDQSTTRRYVAEVAEEEAKRKAGGSWKMPEAT